MGRAFHLSLYSIVELNCTVQSGLDFTMSSVSSKYIVKLGFIVKSSSAYRVNFNLISSNYIVKSGIIVKSRIVKSSPDCTNFFWGGRKSMRKLFMLFSLSRSRVGGSFLRENN